MLVLEEAAPAAAPDSLHAVAPPAETTAIDVANRWIRSRLGATISAVERAFDEYRFDFADRRVFEYLDKNEWKKNNQLFGASVVVTF